MFNWIDWVILIVIAVYVVEGWEEGLLKLGVNLLSFLGSLWLSLKLHGQMASFITEKFGVPQLYSMVLGYVVVAVVSQMILSYLLVRMLAKIPEKFWKSQTNQILGALLSAAKSLVIVAFVLLVISLLPLQGTIKKDIQSSVIGGRLLKEAQKYGGELRQSLKFTTVTPQSNERIQLQVSPQSSDLKINQAAEQEMLKLVNEERTKAGVKSLIWNEKIAVVARAYSKDMFERQYFSHYNPEGKDVGDRLEEAKISYQVAGENLAYAPNVPTAHEGLMNSEGHRKNILYPDFKKVGIGVIDGGIYGLMFTQVFTD